MASQRQRKANRLNAEKSTGPRTPGGKARSRRNAITHGLTAREIVLAHEDPAKFEALSEDLHLRFRPCDGLEEELVGSRRWAAVAVETGPQCSRRHCLTRSSEGPPRDCDLETLMPRWMSGSRNWAAPSSMKAISLPKCSASPALMETVSEKRSHVQTQHVRGAPAAPACGQR